MKHFLFIILSLSFHFASAQNFQKAYCQFLSNDGVITFSGSRIDSAAMERAAIDISLSPFEQMIASSFEMRVKVVGGIEKIDLVVWSNAVNASGENTPDTVITQQFDLIPDVQNLSYAGGSIETYDLEFNLLSPITLTSGVDDTIFWIDVVAYPSTPNEDVWWSSSTAVTDNALALIPQGGTEWILTGTSGPFSVSREGVYKLIGNCESTVSLEEQGFHQARIYPNPITDDLNIEVDDDSFFMRITDILGREYYRCQVVGNSYKLETDRFPAGPYFVYITLSDGNSLIRSIRK